MEVAPDTPGHFLEDVVGVMRVAAEPAEHRHDRRAVPVDQVQEDLPFGVQDRRDLPG